jgi:L-asparaginase
MPSILQTSPELAQAGVHIRYNKRYIRYPGIREKLVVSSSLSQNVAILKIFPGISADVVNAITAIPRLQAIILETYGSGNAPTTHGLSMNLAQLYKKGRIIINVTQCHGGSVEMGLYKTGRMLMEAGVISGRDITTEASTHKNDVPPWKLQPYRQDQYVIK